MPPPADPCAGPISYNNVELLYANSDTRGSDGSEDGLNLRLEYSPMANVYFTGSLSYTDTEPGSDLGLSAGIGGYVPLTDNIHLAGDIGILYVNYDYYRQVNSSVRISLPQYVTDSSSDTGWYVRPHLRAKWGCLEAHAGFEYVDINGENDWSWFLQLYYQVAPGWDLTAGYTEWSDSDTNVVTAGVRYKF